MTISISRRGVIVAASLAGIASLGGIVASRTAFLQGGVDRRSAGTARANNSHRDGRSDLRPGDANADMERHL